MVPMLTAVDDACDADMTNESNPSLRISASMLKLRCAGVSSGNGMSPSRYCITCRMLGLAPGNGWEHSNPSLSASVASPASYLPSSLSSTTSASDSFCQWSITQSTSIIRLSVMLCSTGLRPQTTSRMKAPKANTSVRGDAFPDLASSGARYPMVPTTWVVWGSAPWSYNLARPKSPSQVLVREPVGPELELPVFAKLGVLEPSPDEHDDDGDHGEDGRRGDDRQHDFHDLGPWVGAKSWEFGKAGDVDVRSRSVHGEAPAEHVVERLDRAGGGREPHVGRVHEDIREVLRGRHQRLGRLGHLEGSEEHDDLRGLAVVVNPDLHGLGADERQVVEIAGAVVVVAGVGDGDGGEAVDVDADVVVVWVVELGAPDGVELDAEEVVGGVPVVLVVEEAEVLAGQRGGEVVLANEEDDAVAAQGGMMPNTKDAEKDRTGPPGVRWNFSGVGCIAWPLSCAVPLVSSRSPEEVMVAVPSRDSGAPVKPEYTNCSSSPAPSTATPNTPVARRRTPATRRERVSLKSTMVAWHGNHWQEIVWQLTSAELLLLLAH
nr:unnamed protein product [Digitaria exilis]